MPDKDRLTEFSPGCGMLCQLYVPGATRDNITIHANLSVYLVWVMDLLPHSNIPPTKKNNQPAQQYIQNMESGKHIDANACKQYIQMVLSINTQTTTEEKAVNT